MKAVKAVKGFSKKHPVITGVLKAVGVTVVAVGTEAIANRGKGSGGNSRSFSSDNYFSNSSSDYNIKVSKTNDFDDGSLTDRDDPEVRTSPKEHIVSAHGQHYHTNDGLIWKEKQPYPRGGKRDED